MALAGAVRLDEGVLGKVDEDRWRVIGDVRNRCRWGRR